jgi:hypothetical protein
VAVWEHAVLRSSVERGLTMLGFSKPGRSWSELAEIPLGECDHALWGLRRMMFGPSISGFAACPACEENLEFCFEVPEFPQVAAADGEALAGTLAEGEYTIEYRAPTTADVHAAAGISEGTEIRHLFLSRCVLQAHKQGTTISPEEIPEELVQRLEQRLSEENGAADLRLDLRCAKCGKSWEAPFDITAFLWAEWETLARSLLFDVIALARAYGWNESEILAMGVARRRFYLDMVPT